LLAEKDLKAPMITTIHAAMTPELDNVLSLFSHSYLVCISESSKKLAKKTKIYKVINNGVDINLYKFSAKKEDYLAGNVEDPKFFEKDVKPYLSKKIKWIGPISPDPPLNKKQVAKLMQKAKAFLMPVNWPEPFGLVMAEAQSCGTPVIGFDRGAVSELVVNGKTGFVVNPKKGIEGLKKALKDINKINPIDCRRHIEKKFLLEKVAENYEKAYQEIININKK